jgi:hypothetical protein
MRLKSPTATQDGDRGLLGVNMRLDPGQLPPGYASEARNKRFVDGTAVDRDGIRKLSWSNKFNPADITQILRYGITHGGGIFTEPITRVEWIIVAAGGKAWKTREGTHSTQVQLPPGVTLDGPVHFIDTFDKLIMLRGRTKQTLILESLDEGFKVPLAPGPGLVGIPNSHTGIAFANRVLIPNNRDQVWTSDLLEYFEGSIQDDFRVHTGEVDNIVGLARFNDTTIVVGKDYGYHFVFNVYGNLAAITLDTITTEYGLKAAQSFVQKGNELWSLADKRGIVAIGQTAFNQLQARDVPVSHDIQPLIDRIKWSAAGGAVAASHANRIYFAVPIDNPFMLDTEELAPTGNWAAATVSVSVVPGQRYSWTKGANETQLANGTEILTATGEFIAQGSSAIVSGGPVASPYTFSLKAVFRDFNNAVLVYDTINEAWSGYDESSALMVKSFLKFSFYGSQQLGFLSDDGFLNLYGWGWDDDLGSHTGIITRAAVSSRLITRGYGGRRNRAVSVSFALSTWSPRLTIKSRTDGVNEEKIIRSQLTRSRTRYYRPFDKAPYDVANPNDDHGAAYREDYSVNLDEPAGGAGTNLGTGINADQHQEWEFARRIHSRGRFTQFIFDNDDGHTAVKPILADQVPGEERRGALL